MQSIMSLNPSRRYQKQKATKISFATEGGAEWVGDPYYFEAKRHYRIKSIRRKIK